MLFVMLGHTVSHVTAHLATQEIPLPAVILVSMRLNWASEICASEITKPINNHYVSN